MLRGLSMPLSDLQRNLPKPLRGVLVNMSIILEHKIHEKIYYPSRIPQRLNPTYLHNFDKPIQCKFCIENVQGVKGKKSHYKSLNSIWGHFIYEHSGIDFKPYLMSLADRVIEGDLS